jgi:hypothetical protein
MEEKFYKFNEIEATEIMYCQVLYWFRQNYKQFYWKDLNTFSDSKHLHFATNESGLEVAAGRSLKD